MVWYIKLIIPNCLHCVDHSTTPSTVANCPDFLANIVLQVDQSVIWLVNYVGQLYFGYVTPCCNTGCILYKAVTKVVHRTMHR